MQEPSDLRSVSLTCGTCHCNLHNLVVHRGVGDLNHELFGDPLSSMSGLYGFEVKFLRREDDCAPFVVRCDIKGSFENEILFLLPVRWARLMGAPGFDLDVTIAKFAA